MISRAFNFEKVFGHSSNIVKSIIVPISNAAKDLPLLQSLLDFRSSYIQSQVQNVYERDIVAHSLTSQSKGKKNLIDLDCDLEI